MRRGRTQLSPMAGRHSHCHPRELESDLLTQSHLIWVSSWFLAPFVIIKIPLISRKKLPLWLDTVSTHDFPSSEILE